MAVKIKLTSARFTSPPTIMRIIMINTTINTVLQPIVFRMAAARVLSSSSGKTGGARNFRSAFRILRLSLLGPLGGGRLFKELNRHLGIVKQAANLSDGRLKDLLIFCGGTDRGCHT